MPWSWSSTASHVASRLTIARMLHGLRAKVEVVRDAKS